VGNPEGKRPLGRCRGEWEDNIKMVWTRLMAQDRDRWKALLNTVMNLRVALNIGKFISSCATGGFSRRTQFHEVSKLSYGTWRKRSAPEILVRKRLGKGTTCNIK
jgi:hypothetical protein